MKYVITVDGKTFRIDIQRAGRVWVNHRPYDVDFQRLDGQSQYLLLVDHRSYETHVEAIEDDGCRLVVDGRPYQASLQPQGPPRPEDAADQSGHSETGEVCAPLPGVLMAVPVIAGQRVVPGEVVAVLESMKMNLELRSPRGGVVQSVNAAPGKDVSQGEVLVRLEPEG